MRIRKDLLFRPGIRELSNIHRKLCLSKLIIKRLRQLGNFIKHLGATITNSHQFKLKLSTN